MGTTTKEKKELRQRAFKYLNTFGDNMQAKFSNICSKTGSYDVPLELFQKRTPRKNRVLISWKAVKENNLTMAQLNTFEGGVVVNFINNDFFDETNKSSEVFMQLRDKLGSDEKVSAIISIKSENGSSSSAKQREAFEKLIDNTEVMYKGQKVIIKNDNYEAYAISQDINRQGCGNEVWSGFIFISIRGGEQDTIETHRDKELTLFNPACEYASADVCEDINLVMAYYALLSIDKSTIDSASSEKCRSLIQDIESMLKDIEYDYPGFKGNLYDHVTKNYSVSMKPGKLTDPIQLKDITIDKFNITTRTEDSIDFTHDEAVIYERYYWDNVRGCVLSPARPTNVFWSYHLSNMMQQNYGLDDYFKYEEERFKKRQKLINGGKL
jgi:hypothetical protein